MRHFLKTVLMILLSVGLIQELLQADKKKGPDGILHPKGLKSVGFLTGNKEQYSHVNDKHNLWIIQENLKKFTEIEQWMKDEGLNFNDDNLRRVAIGINQCVNWMWEDAIRKLLDCDTFEKHLNGETKKKLMENLEKTVKEPKYGKEVIFYHLAGGALKWILGIKF